ncbi:hypothetical protein FJZ53_04610 [Candidatus Woesearchaeota archaeon]|nr:hypothetical protein [Candidatus Woesearchaeota archaeon]
MGRLFKALSITCISIVLGAGLVMGYSACSQLKEMGSESYRKKQEKGKVITQRINKVSLEGMMADELEQKYEKIKINGETFDCESASIIKYHESKKSDKLIVYIQDIHKASSFGDKTVVQESLYNSIDEMNKENSIDMLVLEGTPQEDVTKEMIESNTSNFYKLFWYVFRGFWMPEGKEQSLTAFPAGVAYEYVNDTLIETRGAEDEDIHNTAWYVATTPTTSEGKVWLFEKLVSEKRSEIGVEKTLQYMAQSRKKKAVLVFGAAHTRKIVECLEKEDVSYIVLQPKGVDTYINLIKLQTAMEQ